MQGKRVDAIEYSNQYPFPILKSGEYGKDIDGVWYCVPPSATEDNFEAPMGCLGDGVGNKGHTVVEHEDGSITVSPSILISDGKNSWHGYLEKGIWHKC